MPISEDWYKHQLAHSVDWAVRSRFHWFLSGGLNLQSVHHCFPTVDHSHLPALRRVLEDVCQKHEVEMHHFSGYAEGILSHAKHLGLGRKAPSVTLAHGAEEGSVGPSRSRKRYTIPLRMRIYKENCKENISTEEKSSQLCHLDRPSFSSKRSEQRVYRGRQGHGQRHRDLWVSRGTEGLWWSQDEPKCIYFAGTSDM